MTQFCHYLLKVEEMLTVVCISAFNFRRHCENCRFKVNTPIGPHGRSEGMVEGLEE